MSTIDYKIEKYTYKLQNASNKKDASVYRNKLKQYKKQKGGDNLLNAVSTLDDEVKKVLTATDKVPVNEKSAVDDAFKKYHEQVLLKSSEHNALAKKCDKNCEDAKKATEQLIQMKEVIKTMKPGCNTVPLSDVPPLPEFMKEACNEQGKLSEVIQHPIVQPQLKPSKAPKASKTQPVQHVAEPQQATQLMKPAKQRVSQEAQYEAAPVHQNEYGLIGGKIDELLYNVNDKKYGTSLKPEDITRLNYIIETLRQFIRNPKNHIGDAINKQNDEELRKKLGEMFSDKHPIKKYFMSNKFVLNPLDCPEYCTKKIHTLFEGISNVPDKIAHSFTLKSQVSEELQNLSFTK